MKKLTLVFTLFIVVLLVSGCGLRERLLAPPDEIEVPDTAEVAECSDGDYTYMFVYEDPVLYLYYIDDVEQTVEVRDSIQEDIILSGESVMNYLVANFDGNSCEISDYN